MTDSLIDLVEKGAASAESMDAMSNTPLFTPNQSSIRRFADKEPPPRRWLLDNVLPLGKLGLVVAPGGTGKSMFAMQLAISAATGVSVCDGAFKVGEVGAALCLFAEDDEEEVHRRLHAGVDGLSPADRKLALGNLHIVSVVGEDTLLTKKESTGEVTTTTYFQRLELTVKQYENLKLVIIDPASRFRGGDENFSSDVTRFVQACERLVQETGATVLVLHHTNKSSRSRDADQNAARGSSAFVDGARFVINLAFPTPEEKDKCDLSDEEARMYLTVSVTKNNYAPPQGVKIWLHRHEHGVLHHVRRPVSQREIENGTNRQAIVRLVKEAASNGHPWSLSGFVKEYAGTNGMLRIGKDRLKKLLLDMVRTAELVRRPSTSTERKGRPNLGMVLDVPK